MKTRDLEKVNHAPLHVRRSIILGCGGMGTEATIHFKRFLTQHVDSTDFSAIQVLCFDTAQPDYRSSADAHFLGTKERMRIYAEDLGSLVADLGASPRLNAWFPDAQREQAQRISAEVGHSVQGAASTRPFGRIGFFQHWSDVEDRLRRLVNGAPGEAKTHEGESIPVESDTGHIYVVASLGGGTGTGVFMDVAALTRKVLSDLNKTTWEVHAVLVLPEILVRDPKIPSAYTPQIMANSYAALKELDHFLHGNEFVVQYGDGEAARVVLDGTDEKLFNAVYLVDAENAAGNSFVNRDQLASMIGETLFHLTATEAGRNLENRLPDARARMFYQRELPEPSRADRVAGRIKERRKCLYSTFGHSTLRIPVGRLLDYCTAQRALAVAELVGRSDPESPEKAADRARELFAGGAGEEPMLSRLGISSTQLDQALSLNRRVETLPESEVVLQEEDLATRLRQLLGSIVWTEDRHKDWSERAREAGNKLRLRYIKGGEVREAQDKALETIPPRLSRLVDEVCRDEETAVADLLLDHLEQGLVEIRELTLQKLARLQAELGLGEAESGESRHVNQLNALITDIEEQQARRGFFRAWRNRRRVGAWVADVLDLLSSLQKRYVGIAVLEEKAALCQDLIDEINRLDDVVLPYRIDNFRFIKSEIRERRNEALAVCLQSTPPVLHVTPKPVALYQNHYLPTIGVDESPRSLGDHIRRDGLVIGEGQTLTVEQWHQRPQEVLDAILARCSLATTLPGHVIPTRGLMGAKSLWKLDFDSHLFSDPIPGEGASDLQRFGAMVREHADPYVTYEKNDTPSLPWSVLISGSCSGTGSRHWSRYIHAEGEQGFYPGLPNQVTLLMLRKGFPLFKLTRIKEWKRHYDDLMSKHWPLHLFKEAADWQEPYIGLEDDCLCPADELLHLAIARGVVTPDENNTLAYPHPRPDIQRLFQDTHGRPKGLSLTEMTEFLETNQILAREILEDVAEAIVETDGANLVRNQHLIDEFDPCIGEAIRQLLDVA